MVPILSAAAVGILGAVCLKTILMPARWTGRLLSQAAAGGLCLWAVNLSQPLTGLCLPVNPVTALVCGTMGAPGVALLLVLQGL